MLLRNLKSRIEYLSVLLARIKHDQSGTELLLLNLFYCDVFIVRLFILFIIELIKYEVGHHYSKKCDWDLNFYYKSYQEIARNNKFIEVI